MFKIDDIANLLKQHIDKPLSVWRLTNTIEFVNDYDTTITVIVYNDRFDLLVGYGLYNTFYNTDDLLEAIKKIS